MSAPLRIRWANNVGAGGRALTGSCACFLKTIRADVQVSDWLKWQRQRRRKDRDDDDGKDRAAEPVKAAAVDTVPPVRKAAAASKASAAAAAAASSGGAPTATPFMARLPVLMDVSGALSGTLPPSSVAHHTPTHSCGCVRRAGIICGCVRRAGITCTQRRPSTRGTSPSCCCPARTSAIARSSGPCSRGRPPHPSSPSTGPAPVAHPARPSDPNPPLPPSSAGSSIRTCPS